MFIGFGLSSVVLGIIVVINEDPPDQPARHERSRRDVQDDFGTTISRHAVSLQGHIEIVANSNVERYLLMKGSA